MKATLTIDGMSCEHCVKHVTEALREIPTVKVQQVAIGNAVVEFDASRVNESALAAALDDGGYTLTGMKVNAG